MLGVCPGGAQSKQGGEQAPWHLLITLILPGSTSPRGEFPDVESMSLAKKIPWREAAGALGVWSRPVSQVESIASAFRSEDQTGFSQAI